MRFLRTAIVSLFAMACQAEAAVITYNFTATVNSMFEHDGLTNTNTTVLSSAMSGVLISNGNTIHGQFSYDTSTPLSPYYQPPAPANGSYVLYGSPEKANGTSLTFDQNGHTFSSNPDSWLALIQVKDTPADLDGDWFSLSTPSGYSPTDFETTSVFLFDSNGQAFSSAEIPLSLPLSSFGYATFGYSWLRPSDGNQVHADATITSLRLAPTSIPEPGSIALLAIGLLMFAASGKRRRSLGH